VAEYLTYDCHFEYRVNGHKKVVDPRSPPEIPSQIRQFSFAYFECPHTEPVKSDRKRPHGLREFRQCVG